MDDLDRTRERGRPSPRLRLLLALLLLVNPIATPRSATAQESEASVRSAEKSDDASSESSSAVEEIVVFGETSSAEWQDAPVSAVGFDADELLRERINDIADVATYTPNLEIKSFGASNPTLFIRGVGLDDFNANSTSAVAVYQDDVYINSPAGQLFQFFDVAEVNVLRGPQGTLYRNATAGVIQVISQKPTDEFSAWVTATYGNYNEANVQGAISGPIVEEVLLGRAAAWWGRRDGITENRCGGLKLGFDFLTSPCGKGVVQHGIVKDVPPGLEEDVNNKDAWAARTQFLLRAPLPGTEADMEWLLKVHGAQNLALATQFQHRGVQNAPRETGELVRKGILRRNDGSLATDFSNYRDTDGDPYAGGYGTIGDEDLDLWGGALVGTTEIGGVLIKSVTGYEAHKRSILSNDDAGPTNLLVDHISDDAWQVSQELRVSGDFGHRWDFGDGGQWTAGGLFFKEDLSSATLFTSSLSQNVDIAQDFTQDTTSFAFYGHGTWDFLGDFTLEAGLRYNWEQKKFVIGAAGVNNSTGQRIQNLEGEETGTFSGLSGGVSLTYHFGDEKSVYLKYSRGWKPGHFNGGALFSTQLIEPVNPETVDSVELGLRSAWLDNRVLFNLAGFYYNYRDLQIFRLEQDTRGFPIQQLVNASSATVLGVEFDLTARPLRGLEFRLNFGFLSTRYNDFQVGFPERLQIDCPPGEGPRCFETVDILLDYSGNPLIAAPRFAVSGAVEYALPLPYELGMLTPRFSFAWKDEVFFDFAKGAGQRQNLPEGTFAQPAVWLLNASLGYTSPDGRYEVLGWIKNIGDEAIKHQSFDISRSFGVILDAYGDPRTFGITASVYF